MGIQTPRYFLMFTRKTKSLSERAIQVWPQQRSERRKTEQHWVPPLSQVLTTQHGNWNIVLGRKKWRSQGGYPSLAHGGLSLLEVAVPFIELSKPNN